MSDTAPSHHLNLRKPYLELIAEGIKTVEVRVGYPKMRRIQAGHEPTFVSGDDTVVTRVRRVTEYDSFEALWLVDAGGFGVAFGRCSSGYCYV